jgi:hypothetical protein
MFDLTSSSTDGTTVSSYSSPYASTIYRPLTSTPSSSFLFNIPSSSDDQQQSRTDVLSYPNPTQDFM